MTTDDLEQLKRAKALLENSGFAMKLQNSLGKPVAAGFRMLPGRFTRIIHDATESALRRALAVAIRSLGRTGGGAPSNRRHKTMAAVSGGVGGLFGLAGLAFELPVTTTIILRSIADIARSEGESLEDPETQINCLEVLGLGGGGAPGAMPALSAPQASSTPAAPSSESVTESGYYFTRAMLAREVSEAIKYVARRGVAEEGAPVIVRFMAAVAARFGIVVSQKAAATLVPLVGGAAGAVINHLFIDHFQNMARGHFTVRRLERQYGGAAVEAVYRGLAVR